MGPLPAYPSAAKHGAASLSAVNLHSRPLTGATFSLRRLGSFRTSSVDKRQLSLNKIATRGVVIVAIAFSAFAAADPLNQPATLEVIVVDSLSRRPLPNAEVRELSSGQRRMTNERGAAYLTWPSDAPLKLRVRQVGYTPREALVGITTTRRSLTLAMNQVAYVLSGVRARGHCTAPRDTTLLDVSALALDQLQQAAQKYDDFRRAYPFEAFVERRTVAVTADSAPKRVRVAKERYRSDNFDTEYRPGDVVRGRSTQFRVPLLLLSNLGDSVFWEHHCFVARGFQSYHGDRVVRLEFFPTDDVNGPDYAGTATLDSATSMLLRVDFHLTNTQGRREPAKLEGYTTFSSASPFVMVPDSTIAIWWMKTRDQTDWGDPDFAQSVHVDSLKYRRQKPPAYVDMPMR